MDKLKEIKVNYKLDINFENIFKSWTKPLGRLLRSDYMYNIMLFLNEGYKIKNIQPSKENIFKVFSLVDYSKVRVVLIGDEPYHDADNTGIPYAQSENQFVFPPEITEIATEIEFQCKNGLMISPNYELKNWIKNGVLPLYSSLTTEVGKTNSHLLHWREFLRNVVSIISNNKHGIIFMLWGDNAKYYKQFINTNKHYILESDSVTESVNNTGLWETDNFARCNEILTKMNGPDCQINWM